ncbi:AAA family ATPase [Micromonospora lutea]|uniref:AAA domain-containing protein n=1 Tax=Micromonospora lutea TaxID=419825 RepID=A0ABQ4J0D0_9ACTN|nr:AAA family ATPase [Micromonospora lutea]GIJ23619.1 hypothetical protein Vlu01_42430 [Micromonospora lutea]
MRLVKYSVRGLRSLANVVDIPVGRPTIVVGSNDGGKTSCLLALQFLLTGKPEIGEEDRTYAVDDEEAAVLTADGLRHYCMNVTGTFMPTTYEERTLGLVGPILIRRISLEGTASQLEVQKAVPASEDLRNLAELKRDDLRSRAEARNLDPEGSRSSKDAWLLPLQRLADDEISSGSCVTTWIPLARDLAGRLPIYLPFSSTDEPDPEVEIRTALQAGFRQLIDEAGERLSVIRRLEADLQDDLAREADDLRQLIKQRCSRIGEVVIVPHVSFAEGLRSVEIQRAKDDGRRITLRRAGAGRRRQISLAVWEWTSKQLRNPPPDHPGFVIAYDEPDTHLDYAHQRQLFDLILDQCAHDETQMIVATHSLNFIDRVDPADIVHLRLDHQERTALTRLLSPNHSAVDEYLAQIAAAMGLRNSVLLHERCFLGVEGETEMQCLPILYKLAMGKPLQSDGIALINGESNVGALQVAKYLHESGRKVYFLVDNDSTCNSGSKSHFVEEKIRRSGISRQQCMYVGTREIEDLFTDEQWCTAANKLWPRVDDRAWTEEDIAGMRKNGKFSAELDSEVRMASLSAPSGKVGLLFELSTTLTSSEDVPAKLVEHFKTLQAQSG